MNKLVNGILVELTPAEEAEYLAAQIVPFETVKQQKLSDLAALRYSKETGGITLNGMSIATDRESQALITGAWSYSQLNPNVLIDWKAATGWVQIDAATISVIAAVVAGHVQACFSNERALSAAIAATTTIEELNAMDLNDGWPI